MPTLEELKHETLHSELDTLDKETHAGAAGLQEFLTKEAEEEQSSSSPEELVPEVAEVAGAAGVRNLLERDSRERSSSGEEWEKVSITQCANYHRSIRITSVPLSCAKY